MGRVILENVVKRYRDVVAVDNVSLTVEDGEFVALVGPSGCGKTTTLNLIAGLLELSDGNIYIGEQLVNDLDPKDRDIAMVFQNYALYPNKTVYNNLAFPLQMRKTPKAQIDQRVRETARLLSIEPLLDRRPKALSGGQQQRVALGRALVRNPQVFLMDEPLSNLDAKLRVQMRAEISKLQNRLKTTTVYVTHDQVEAMTMGHRIAIMKDGKLQQVGTPLEVYETPANLFVAAFIGTPPMNFVKATVADGGGALKAGTFSLPVPASLRPLVAGKDGKAVVVGIRPENVVDPSKPTRGETARLGATVEVIEPLGHEVLVYARLGGDDLVVAKVDPHRAPAYDAKIELVVELDALHLFDAATERRLAA